MEAKEYNLLVSFFGCYYHEGVPIPQHIFWGKDGGFIWFGNTDVFSWNFWRKRSLNSLIFYPASTPEINEIRNQKLHSTLNQTHDIIHKVWRSFDEKLSLNGIGEIETYKHFVIPKKESVILVGENYIKVWETNRVYFIDISSHSNKRLMKTLRDVGVARRAALRILRG